MKSFVFETSWLDILRKFGDETCNAVINAVLSYVECGREPDNLTPVELMAFLFIRRDIDRAEEERREASVRRAEAGRKGGRAKAAKKLANVAMLENVAMLDLPEKKAGKGVNDGKNGEKLANVAMLENVAMLDLPEKPEPLARVHVRGIVNNLDNNNNNNNIASLRFASARRAGAGAGAREETPAEDETERVKEKIQAGAKRKKQAAERGDARAIIAYYNERIVATGARLRLCETVSEARISAVTARLAKYGEEKVRLCVDKACASHFLNYDAYTAPVNIDWIMGPRNFPKVVDGNYDDKQDYGENNKRSRRREQSEDIIRRLIGDDEGQ